MNVWRFLEILMGGFAGAMACSAIFKDEMFMASSCLLTLVVWAVLFAKLDRPKD